MSKWFANKKSEYCWLWPFANHPVDLYLYSRRVGVRIRRAGRNRLCAEQVLFVPLGLGSRKKVYAPQRVILSSTRKNS